MPLLAQISQNAVSLYLRRFCLVKYERYQMYGCAFKYAQLVEFVGMPFYMVGKTALVHMDADEPIVTCLGSEHFNLIQANADGWSYLLVWFSPLIRPTGAEARLLQRAGVKVGPLR